MNGSTIVIVCSPLPKQSERLKEPNGSRRESQDTSRGCSLYSVHNTWYLLWPSRFPEYNTFRTLFHAHYLERKQRHTGAVNHRSFFVIVAFRSVFVVCVFFCVEGR